MAREANASSNGSHQSIQPFLRRRSFCLVCSREHHVRVQPSSICVEDFETGIIEEGSFKGIPFVRLEENCSGQKEKSLSLRNHVQDAANTKKKTFACPYSSDRLSCYQTTLKLLEWTPPNIGGGPSRIFRKKASKAELEEWEEAGMKWRLSSKPSRVIGKCQINKLLKKVAVWCKYDNPDRCTAHGKRSAGGVS